MIITKEHGTKEVQNAGISASNLYKKHSYSVKELKLKTHAPPTQQPGFEQTRVFVRVSLNCYALRLCYGARLTLFWGVFGKLLTIFFLLYSTLRYSTLPAGGVGEKKRKTHQCFSLHWVNFTSERGSSQRGMKFKRQTDNEDLPPSATFILGNGHSSRLVKREESECVCVCVCGEQSWQQHSPHSLSACVVY